MLILILLENQIIENLHMLCGCHKCNKISRKSQKLVALSSIEAKYIAAIEAIKKGLWLKGLLNELGFVENQLKICTDSQSAIF